MVEGAVQAQCALMRLPTLGHLGASRIAPAVGMTEIRHILPRGKGSPGMCDPTARVGGSREITGIQVRTPIEVGKRGGDKRLATDALEQKKKTFPDFLTFITRVRPYTRASSQHKILAVLKAQV